MINKKAVDSIVGLVAMLAVTAFLLIGFLADGWRMGWLVFLAIPVAAIIVDMAIKKKSLTGLIPGLVAILAAIAYLIMGFGYDLWHPGWIVFLSIPIAGIIAGMFEPDKADYPSGRQAKGDTEETAGPLDEEKH